MRPHDPTPALRQDAQGLEQLALALQRAIAKQDRNRALELLNDLRELARHAFALAQHW